MKKIKLGDVCNFSEERTAVACLDEKNYISTENLLPNKSGITDAATLPKTSTTPAFVAGNVLLSNIRPYFKKIWYATFDGGCSADVLVLKVNESIDAKFLYYVLSEDKFFDYMTATAKGTKMPRGDKLSIMNYSVPDFPLATQKKIAALLGALDDKIALNKKINATLEAMARTVYMHKFFRKPPNGIISDIIIENPKSTISVGAAKNFGGAFPFFTSGEAILSWHESLVDGRNIFLNTGGNASVKFYVGKASYSTDTWCITAENLSDYLYLLLKVIEPELDKKFFQGTGLKHLQKPLLKERAIYIPTEAEREEFNSVVQPCFTKISANVRESRRLAELRDWLLPMLMNGQVSV